MLSPRHYIDMPPARRVPSCHWGSTPTLYRRRHTSNFDILYAFVGLNRHISRQWQAIEFSPSGSYSWEFWEPFVEKSTCVRISFYLHKRDAEHISWVSNMPPSRLSNKNDLGRVNHTFVRARERKSLPDNFISSSCISRLNEFHARESRFAIF